MCLHLKKMRASALCCKRKVIKELKPGKRLTKHIQNNVASAMDFCLSRCKMMNGIGALHSPPKRKDATEKNGMLLRSSWCVVLGVFKKKRFKLTQNDIVLGVFLSAISHISAQCKNVF